MNVLEHAQKIEAQETDDLDPIKTCKYAELHIWDELITYSQIRQEVKG